MNRSGWLWGPVAFVLVAATQVACFGANDDAEEETSAQTEDPLVFGGYCSGVVSPGTCDPSVFCGDLNADRRITVTDGNLALRLAANGGYDYRADVNGDGKVTVSDAQMILSRAAGNRVTFNCRRR